MGKTKRKSLKKEAVPVPDETPGRSPSKKRNQSQSTTNTSSANITVNESRGKNKVTKRKQLEYAFRVGNNYRKTMMTKKLFKQIHRLQRSTDLLIPRTRFIKLVREIMTDYYPNTNYMLGSNAAEALQEAAESYVVAYLGDSNICAMHAHRVTLKPIDMALVKTLRDDPYLD